MLVAVCALAAGAARGGTAVTLHRQRRRLEFAAELSGKPSICSRKILLWAHHKTGSVMGRAATRALNVAFNELCNTSFSQVAFECEPRSEEKFQRMLHPPPRADGFEQEVCLLHLTRDPMEVVVSGMVYHRRADEKWVLAPLDSLTPDSISRAALWTQLYLRGVAAAAAAASSGQYGGALAPVLPGESYALYLRRVPAANGLLAEYLAAADARLPFQEAVARALSPPQASGRALCGASVCLSSFTGSLGQCEAAWVEIMRVIGAPARWAAALGAAAAVRSCPASPAVAGISLKHSSQHSSAAPQMRPYGNGIGNPAALAGGGRAVNDTTSDPAVLLALLEALDEALLQGSLRRLSDRAGCPRSAQYGHGEHGAEVGGAFPAAPLAPPMASVEPSPELLRLVALGRGDGHRRNKAKRARGNPPPEMGTGDAPSG